MRVLTICSAGTVRSVAMAHRLKHDYGHDAIPAGRDTNSECTLDMLSEWAERIIVMNPSYGVGILKANVHKVVPAGLTDVGPDVWQNPLAPSLQKLVGEIARNLHERGYLKKG